MTDSTINNRPNKTRTLSGRLPGSPHLYQGAGIVAFVIIWHLLSIQLGTIVVASPYSTLLAFVKLLRTDTFWQTLAITGSRFIFGFASGTLAGASLGLIGGFNPKLKKAFEPLHWILMSIPPVVLVMISMILFGMGSLQTIFVTALLILPIMYTSTIEGIDTIDPALLEMGRLYRADRKLMLGSIYIPGIGSQIISGLTLSAGLGIRIVVLAEVLGAYSGIGHRFSLARTNLETEELYAWIIVCLLLAGIFEFIIFKPLRKRMNRWKNSENRRSLND